MPDYDADGDVTQIGLATIKMQNWDKGSVQSARIGRVRPTLVEPRIVPGSSCRT